MTFPTHEINHSRLSSTHIRPPQTTTPRSSIHNLNRCKGLLQHNLRTFPLFSTENSWIFNHPDTNLQENLHSAIINVVGDWLNKQEPLAIQSIFIRHASIDHVLGKDIVHKCFTFLTDPNLNAVHVPTNDNLSSCFYVSNEWNRLVTKIRYYDLKHGIHFQKEKRQFSTGCIQSFSKFWIKNNPSTLALRFDSEAHSSQFIRSVFKGIKIASTKNDELRIKHIRVESDHEFLSNVNPLLHIFRGIESIEGEKPEYWLSILQFFRLVERHTDVDAPTLKRFDVPMFATPTEIAFGEFLELPLIMPRSLTEVTLPALDLPWKWVAAFLGSCPNLQRLECFGGEMHIDTDPCFVVNGVVLRKLTTFSSFEKLTFGVTPSVTFQEIVTSIARIVRNNPALMTLNVFVNHALEWEHLWEAFGKENIDCDEWSITVFERQRFLRQVAIVRRCDSSDSVLSIS